MTIFCPNGHDNPDTNRFCQSCGSQIVTPVSPAMIAGVILNDRYQIVKEIGQGGFGRTYLCEDVNRFNEPCVLKEFAPQVQGTALLTKAQQLFEREAGVMYRLEHPQIPRFREMFRVNRSGVGQLFLVQDYVAGDNYQQLLRHKLKQGHTFTEIEVTEFLTQILPVLGYIHSLGVIHRDISPDNLIRRQSDGLPVLIDFGGVKQVAVNAASQYMSGNMVPSDIPTRLGKVGYAPNEQMQRGVVFPHSDLYALAATTLVLLTGKEPPDLIDAQSFTWNWREYTSLSPNLAGILDRMLQLHARDRFPSAQDILTALQSGDLGQIIHVSPQPLPVPVQQLPTIAPQAQPPTVAATLKPQSALPLTIVNKKKSSLMQIVVKTWLAIAAIVGAVALGGLVAMLLSKRGGPSRSAVSSVVAAASNTSTNARSIASNRSNNGGELTLPTALASMGVDPIAYSAAVKQVFIGQQPQLKAVNLNDRQVRSQVETISTNLGAKLTSQLSPEAIEKIGHYESTDRDDWQAQVNNLHLSERALIDLTNAKYRSITDDYSAQKMGIGTEQFLDTPLGQIYLATMLDRVRAIQSRQALSEVVFPVGGTSGTVSGTLKPGEGKAYIASLVGGQEIAATIQSDTPINLSIYPPTTNLPTILAAAPTQNWAGKTSINGYHQFVLVSQSDRAIPYQFKLTASALKPTNVPQPKSDRQSLF
jgi:serine/threonine protein kinase, bacterial